MMKPIKLIPKRLTGQVQVPPSKSIAHRAILCAALAGGGSRVDNLALSDDIQATLRGMRALGADLTVEKGTLCAGDRHRPTGEAVVDCGESGSTLRFLLPVFLARVKPASHSAKPACIK